MTNTENLREIYDKIDSRGEELKQLKHFPSGVALISLLEDIHNVVLVGLINTPASDVHRVAEFQGKYKVISSILNQILEDEDADKAE